MLTLLAQNTLPIGETAQSQGVPTAQNYSNSNPAAGFGGFVSGLLSTILIIAALLVFFYLIWGAIEWITAGGDKGKTEKARDRITQSIIGLIVLAATTALFMLVQSFLGINVLNFGGSNGANYSGRSSSGTTTTSGTGGSGGCTVGQKVSDGGAGGYCTNGGAALVQCFGPGQGMAKYQYNHFEPCSCISGKEQSGINFGSC